MSVGQWNPRREALGHPATQTAIEIRPGQVELSLEGLGTCRVGGEGAVFSAHDDQAFDALDDTLGLWAYGVWLGLNGVFAFHGSVLERDGVAIALVGGARSAITVTAFALTRRGWRLVADDVCPLIVDGSAVIAQAALPEIHIDSLVAKHVPWQVESRRLLTPRSRTAIAVDGAASCELTHLFTLIGTNTRPDARIVTPGLAEQRSEFMAASCLGQSLLSATPGLRSALEAHIDRVLDIHPLQALLTPRTWTPDAFTPPQLAEWLEEAATS